MNADQDRRKTCLPQRAQRNTEEDRESNKSVNRKGRKGRGGNWETKPLPQRTQRTRRKKTRKQETQSGLLKALDCVGLGRNLTVGGRTRRRRRHEGERHAIRRVDVGKKKPLPPRWARGVRLVREDYRNLLLRRLLGRLIGGAGLRSRLCFWSRLRSRSRLSCRLAGRSCGDAAAGRGSRVVAGVQVSQAVL
jgi:hypothetical protein